MRLVGKQEMPSMRAQKAIEKVKKDGFRSQVVSIYNSVSSRTTPHSLRLPPTLLPLSPSIGMGMEINFTERMRAIYIDDNFLGDVLSRNPKTSYDHYAARYMILSAASYAFVKDVVRMEHITEKDPHVINTLGWQRAAGLSLKVMNINAPVEQEMLGYVRTTCREREMELMEDYMFCAHVAAQYDVNVPKLKRVEPWIIGMAFPETVQ